MMMLKSVFSKYARGRGRNFFSRRSESEEVCWTAVAVGAVGTPFAIAAGWNIGTMIFYTEDSNERLKRLEEHIIKHDERLKELEEENEI